MSNQWTNPWDDEDLWVLHNLRDTLSSKQMAALLGRTQRAVLAKAEMLGLRFWRNQSNRRRTWAT